MNTQNSVRMIAEGLSKRKLDEIERSSEKRQRLEEKERIVRSGATIHFGPWDGDGVRTPHNDALIVTTGVGDYDVRRILTDSGSVVDIITLTCLQRMELVVELKEA